MKQLYIIIALSLISICTTAQITGGGVQSTINSKKIKKVTDQFNPRYQNYGFSFATNNHRKVFSGKWGITANFGKLYHIQSLKKIIPGMPKEITPGIEATFFDFRLMTINDDVSRGVNVNMGLRVGPAVTFALKEGINLDVYWAFNSSFSYVYFKDEIVLSLFRGILHCPGVRIRLNKFMFGFEWQMGHQKYTLPNGTSANPYHIQAQTNTFNIKIGKCLY